MSEVLLQAEGLTRHFKVGGSLLRKPATLRAVDDVSLSVTCGETLAIVGESGCGKSTLARMLMRLIEPTTGTMRFDGREIAGAKGAALKDMRRDMQFIFQDPFSSLNPRMSVGKLVGEPLETHEPQLSTSERRAKVETLLAQVGLRPDHAQRYPHEFSGGQRQRIGIARALASGPKLIIGDEPVSALDVSVQAQVINLLADLRDDLGLTLVIIAHDLAVIRHMSDRVMVMYLGRVVEEGPTDTLFAQPAHPYTMALLSAIPVPEHGVERKQIILKGEMPSPLDPPTGCTFHTRCPFARAKCRTEAPALISHTSQQSSHKAACHLTDEIRQQAPQALPSVQSRNAEVEARFDLYAQAIAKPAALRPKHPAPNPIPAP